MRNIIIIILFQFCLWNSIYGQEKDNTIMFYSEHVASLPVIKINNDLFLADVDSLVLSYKLQTTDKYKHYVYSINVHSDTSKLASTIYLGLVPEAALSDKQIKGIFKRGDAIFLYYLDNPDSLYSYTGEYEQIQYKRLDIKIGNQFIEEDVNREYDFPSWVFLYKNHRLELCSTQFVPKKEDMDKKRKIKKPDI